ncbi:hypothetical protein CRENBAI_005154, partial [Crenichthys baileyi]
PPSNGGAYFLPATLPASGWCLCPLVYLWLLFSVRVAVVPAMVLLVFLGSGGPLDWNL